MGSWMFPLALVLVMAASSANFGSLASAVTPMRELYPDISAFWVNMVNFNYFWLSFAFSPLVPVINAKLPRAYMLFICAVLMLIGTVLQCCYKLGFAWLFLGSVVSNFPQIVLSASLADTLADYVPQAREAFALGAYVCLQNVATGVSYLLGVWFLGNATDLSTNLLYFFTAQVALLIWAAVLATVYMVSMRDESKLPLGADLDEAAFEMDDKGTDRCSYWALMIAYACQNAVGTVLGLLFSGLQASRGLTDSDLTAMVVAMGALTIPVPVVFGLIEDLAQSWNALPAGLIFAQTVLQIAVLYWVDSAIGVMALVVVFSIANSALTTVFLPALLHVDARYSRSFTNAAMATSTTAFIALGSLLPLLDADNTILATRPALLWAGIGSSILAALALRPQPKDGPFPR